MTSVFLLMEEEALEARIAINDPIYGAGRAHVVLRPVNLLRLDQLIIEEMKKRNVVAGLAPIGVNIRVMRTSGEDRGQALSLL
jgi:hypothetical protein